MWKTGQLSCQAEYNRFAERGMDTGQILALAKSNKPDTWEDDQLSGFWDEARSDSKEHFLTLERDGRPIPDNFDARTRWPHCWTLHHVYNQASCGNCWVGLHYPCIAE